MERKQIISILDKQRKIKRGEVITRAVNAVLLEIEEAIGVDDTPKKRSVVNNDIVEHLDVIISTTTTTFSWRDRVRILFGKKLTTTTNIYTMHDHCQVVASEAKTVVEPIRKRKEEQDTISNNV